jgi:hypothetical protein
MSPVELRQPVSFALGYFCPWPRAHSALPLRLLETDMDKAKLRATIRECLKEMGSISPDQAPLAPRPKKPRANLKLVAKD